MKEEEKKRLKRVSYLNKKLSEINGILNSINDSLGVSLVTKYIGDMGQVVGKEFIMDNTLLSEFMKMLKGSQEAILNEFNQLTINS